MQYRFHLTFTIMIIITQRYNNKPQRSQEVNDIRLGCEVILVKNCSFLSVQTVFTNAKRRVSWKKSNKLKNQLSPPMSFIQDKTIIFSNNNPIRL